MRTPALLLIAAAGLLPATASAATVRTERVCTGDKSCVPRVHLRYAAAPGEANDLQVTVKGRGVLVRDRVAIAAGRGCHARADGSVTCVGDHATVDLADLADHASISDETAPNPDPGWPPARMTFQVAGGSGDDVLAGGDSLQGGPGHDRLTGTPGDDSLDGGAGPDVLAGGAGDDWLTGDGGHFGYPAEPASDLLDGGTGENTASYSGHTASVHVDLTAQIGGAAGEADRMSGISHVSGGEADDVLEGDAGANLLSGNGGRDTLAGLDGDDELRGSGRLDGGPGDDLLQGTRLGALLFGGAGDDHLGGVAPRRDAFAGGPGADVIHLEPGGDPPLSCGGGDDVVGTADLTRLPIECERVDVLGWRVPAHPRRLRDGRLAFATPLRGQHRRRLDLRLLSHGRPRGRPFAVRRLSATRRRVIVRIPRAVRRLRRRPLAAQVCIGTSPRRRISVRACWVIDLKA